MKHIFIILFALCFSVDAQAQCFPDRHNTAESNAWKSCIRTQNPNAARGISHWIMYDLGQIYEIKQSRFWNFNVPGQDESNQDHTRNGVREMYVDISWDGVSWGEWGLITLNESDGSSFYEGEEGPDFSGSNARFVLFTPVSNHGGNCFGLSEIKIDVGEKIVTSVNEEEIGPALLLAPNPANDFTVLTYEAPRSGNATITITDNLGRIIQSRKESVVQGSNQMTLDTKSMISGLYHLSLIQQDMMRTIDFSVNR